MTVIVKIEAGNELEAGVREHKRQRAEQLRDTVPGKSHQIDTESVDSGDVRTFTTSLVIEALAEHGIDVDEDDVAVISG